MGDVIRAGTASGRKQAPGGSGRFPHPDCETGGVNSGIGASSRLATMRKGVNWRASRGSRCGGTKGTGTLWGVCSRGVHVVRAGVGAWARGRVGVWASWERRHGGGPQLELERGVGVDVELRWWPAGIASVVMTEVARSRRLGKMSPAAHALSSARARAHVGPDRFTELRGRPTPLDRRNRSGG